MREGRELVGWGMATGVWEAMMMQSSASATLTPTAGSRWATATADIGTGTYTILTQIAADTLGLPMDDGDHQARRHPPALRARSRAAPGRRPPPAPPCRTPAADVCEQVFKLARQRWTNSPLANADFDRVVFADGRISVAGDPGRSVSLVEALQAAGVDKVEAVEQAGPDKDFNQKFAAYTHSAVFVEVKVDEELGSVRVTRVVSRHRGRQDPQPEDRAQPDPRRRRDGDRLGAARGVDARPPLGRFMNHNFGEYHVPVNADIDDIDVIFVDEEDKANPLGVKGLGEIGIVGTAAAIANAVFHATGKRVRDLPITIDKLL